MCISQIRKTDSDMNLSKVTQSRNPNSSLSKPKPTFFLLYKAITVVKNVKGSKVKKNKDGKEDTV